MARKPVSDIQNGHYITRLAGPESVLFSFIKEGLDEHDLSPDLQHMKCTQLGLVKHDTYEKWR